MSSLTLQEVYKHYFKLQKNTEASAVWNNNTLAVLMGKEIYILESANNLYLDHRGFDMQISAIPCTSTSVATKLLEGYKNQVLPLSELISLTIDPALLAHNPDLVKDSAMFISFEWSPEPLHSNKYVIATLTNLGHVEIFGQEGKDWLSLLNLSDTMYQLLNYECVDDFKANKEAAKALITVAMCWIKLDNGNCILVTAQKNNKLMFWSIQNEDDRLQAKVIGQSKLDTAIVNLFCVPISQKSFILFYATIMGELYSLHCCLDNETVSFNNAACLWNHQDRMVVLHLKYTHIENKLIVLFVKYRHLVTICYNEADPEKSAQSFTNVDDERITCLTQSKDNFYISTEDFKLHKVNLTLEAQSAAVTTEQVKVSETYLHNNLYSISISSNGAIFALCSLERMYWNRSDGARINLILLESGQDEINIVLSNPTKNLAHVWDCMELIRYKCIKQKILPSIDYIQLFKEGQTDVYKLRIFLDLLKLINKMKIIRSCSFGPQLDNITEERVKELILSKHAQEMLNKIMTSYEKNGKNLTELQNETCIFIKDYLEYYCKKYKFSMEVNSDIFKLVSPCEYECQCCDEKYNGQWYGSSHLNVMCSVTFSQINSYQYLYCPKCNATARIELFNDCPTCTFCDAVLIKNV